jgi:hypothetical protein
MTTLLPDTRTQTRRICNHIPTSQQNTYYINKRPGRTPQKYSGRRETPMHNYYIQTKQNKTKQNNTKPFTYI